MGLGLPDVDQQKCGGCGDCVKMCPGHAVELVEGKATIARPDDCDYCAECEVFCNSSAIKCYYEIVICEESGKA
ncbi:MAG: 4Fe-4S binding protein [Dehalococcoidia bacterium]|nr:4Fe-4S binding protein [Dehalococcoidia bacterium]